MSIDDEQWAEWGRAVRGESGAEPDQFTYMIEVLDEFQLRVLLRDFDRREALLDRWARFEFDPPEEYTDGEVTELVRAHVAELSRLAAIVYPDSALTTASGDMEIDVVGSDAVQTGFTESTLLGHNLFDHYWPGLQRFGGGRHLWEVCYGRNTDQYICLYLTGPLLDFEMALEAYAAVVKTGRQLWIEGDRVVVTEPRTRSRWFGVPGWVPSLDWPTDSEIEQRRQVRVAMRKRAARAQNPNTEAAELAMLAGDEEPAVRAQVARNPSTPSDLIKDLCFDPSEQVLNMILTRKVLPPEAIAVALAHDDPDVRSVLARHENLEPELLVQLAIDAHAPVRIAVARNVATPIPVLAGMQNDSNRNVRNTATRRIEAAD